MSELYHYSPEEVIVLLSGVSINGMAEGTFVSINKEDPPFTTKVSADGVVSRTYVKSPTYTVNLTLHSTSPSNDILTDFWLADESSKRGFFSVLIKDALGSSLFDAETAWISKTPSMDFGDKVSNRDWVLTCVESSVNFGGNGEMYSSFSADRFENVLRTPIGYITTKIGNLL